MEMNKKVLATAVGVALGAGSMAASAALVPGANLSIDAGSKFNLGFDVAISGVNGITIGAVQGASGSHAGAPNGSENPDIDTPWNFFGNTGMHQTTSPIVDLGGTGNTHQLDFSGWDVTWNGIATIPMGGDTANFTSDTGVATIVCSNPSCSNSSTFTLTYSAHVPLGDPSNFGGAFYSLLINGHVSNVPVPAAAWLFGSGLIGLAGIARRKKA